MKTGDVIDVLESYAPNHLQESYDNSGLLVGDRDAEVNGVLVCLDSTPEVIDEAVELGCNLVIAHHPIIFSGLKTLTGANYVQRTIIAAVKNDVAVYAIHTNLDNVLASGVNGRIADHIGLRETSVLREKEGSDGDPNVGSGVVGWLPESMEEMDFLGHLKASMRAEVIRHTQLTGRQVEKVAVCGGSGSFLLEDAIAAGAQVFVTADFKYHQFFDADGQIVVCDIGHYESEQFTVDLICDLIRDNFPNFAANSSKTGRNPVTYYY